MTVYPTAQPRAQAGAKAHHLTICEKLSSRWIISLRTIVRKDHLLILLTSYRSASIAHIHGLVMCEIRTIVRNVHNVTFERSFVYRPHACFLILILNTILRTIVRNYPFRFTLKPAKSSTDAGSYTLRYEHTFLNRSCKQLTNDHSYDTLPDFLFLTCFRTIVCMYYEGWTASSSKINPGLISCGFVNYHHMSMSFGFT